MRPSVLSIVFVFKKFRLPYENPDSKNVTKNRISVTFFMATILSFPYNRPSFISY